MAKSSYSNKSYVGMLVCARCGEPVGVLLDRRLKDTFENGKNYSDGHTLCDKCEKEVTEFENIVAAGGIYFQCTKCKAAGVIKYEGASEDARRMIEAVRAQQFGRGTVGWMSMPVGIEFDSCDQHGEE